MTKFVPRPYQVLIRDHILNHERGSVFASPGMGKTSATVDSFAELKLFGEANRMLVLAPKRVAETSWPAERVKWETSFGHLTMAAAVGTPAQRLAALRSTPDILCANYEQIEWLIEQYGGHWPFDLVAADECFVAGTLVTAEHGDVPIESLKPGTRVLTRKGFKRVKRIYRKKTESLVEVRSVNGARVVCTPSHQFWTESGWKSAEDFGSTTVVHTRVQGVPKGFCHRAQPSYRSDEGSVLQHQLPINLCHPENPRLFPCPQRCGADGVDQREQVVERRHPDAREHPAETQCGAQGAGLDPERSARGERSRYECFGSIGGRTSDARLGLEPTDFHQGVRGPNDAQPLQTRLRLAGEDGLLGSGRAEPQSREGAGPGCEENPLFEQSRVDSVSAVECASGTVVFDIEVEDEHEYFAGGFLVHNCTRLKGLRISLQRRKRKDGTLGEPFIVGQGASRAKALAYVAHTKVRRWVNLTGSPATNGLVDVWGPQWFVDAGKRLGNSFEAFSQRWFRMAYGSSREQQRLEPLPHAQPEIERLLAQTSITVDARDWFDIDEPIERHILVDLPQAARKQYDEMQRDLFTYVNEHPLEAFGAGVKSLKCLQIASGSVIHDDKGSWTPVHDEKIEALRSIVEETNGEPLLVAYQYIADRERILKAFPFAKSLEKNSDATIREFQAGKLRMLVVHPASAGHGLDLQYHCRTLVDYSSGYNLEFDEQVIERIGPTRQAQIGKKVAVFRYRIIARGTIEETAVIPRLKSKASVQDALKAAMKISR